MTLSRDRTGLDPSKLPDWREDPGSIPPGAKQLYVTDSAGRIGSLSHETGYDAIPRVVRAPDFWPSILGSLVAGATYGQSGNTVTVTATGHGLPTTKNGYRIFWPGSAAVPVGWYFGFGSSAGGLVFWISVRRRQYVHVPESDRANNCIGDRDHRGAACDEYRSALRPRYVAWRLRLEIRTREALLGEVR